MIFNKVKEKAGIFRVSQDMIKPSLLEDYNFGFQMVSKSNSKQEFRQNVKDFLYNEEESTFYDFSLVLGLQFGVYNLYCYQYLSNEVKKKIVKSNPDPEDTLWLFQTCHQAIATRVAKEYDIDTNQVIDVMRDMLKVKEDNPYYHNPIAEEIGKLVTSYNLYFANKNMRRNHIIVNHFFESGQGEYYYRKCNQEKKSHK